MAFSHCRGSKKSRKKQSCGEDPLIRIRKALHQFVERNKRLPKDLQLPLTGTVISGKAHAIKTFYLKAHQTRPLLSPLEFSGFVKFTASQQWCSKFMVENKYVSVALHGEAGGVDMAAAEAQMELIRAAVQEYGLEFVYNMDETGLFFRLLPNRAYVKKEEARSARGSKLMKAKDRVTLYVTTNGTGTDLLPLGVIGTAKDPRCFRLTNPPLPYYSQRKAWSDSNTFKQWFCEFCQHVLLKTAHKILLLLDNCGPHCPGICDPTSQVTIMYLPPGCTSVWQPMDCGVIAMIKKAYRFELLRRILLIYEDRATHRITAERAKMGAGTKELEEGHTPHLQDVMEILLTIWSRVWAQAVANCWIKLTVTRPPKSLLPGTAVAEAATDDAAATDAAKKETRSASVDNNNADGEELPRLSVKYPVGTRVSKVFEGKDENE